MMPTVAEWLGRKVELNVDERRWLLADTLGWHRGEVFNHENYKLGEQTLEILEQRLCRRLLGEPHAYVVGHQDFYGRKFHVGPGVLIPRPETEMLVDRALALLGQQHAIHASDWGAGTGCLGITLHLERSAWEISLFENDPQALRFLRLNLKEHQLESRLKVFERDVEGLKSSHFDLILANPPYIDWLDEEVDPWVRKFEPPQALFADHRGFGCIQSWIDRSTVALRSGGIMLMEIGARQGPTVCELFLRTGCFDAVTLEKDLAGLDRLVIAVKK